MNRHMVRLLLLWALIVAVGVLVQWNGASSTTAVLAMVGAAALAWPAVLLTMEAARLHTRPEAGRDCGCKGQPRG